MKFTVTESASDWREKPASPSAERFGLRTCTGKHGRRPKKKILITRYDGITGTNWPISPPLRWISRTMVDEIGCSAGSVNKKTVSISGLSALFIEAMLCSYSKSMEFLNPRTIQRAPIERQYSAVNPRNVSTRTLFKPENVFRMASTRWSTVNKFDLVVLTPIATTISSNKGIHRSTIFLCPCVNGSNEPGNTAHFFMLDWYEWSEKTKNEPCRNAVFRCSREWA